MAKEVAGIIKLQIKGGAANPSPPVGPALGSKGVLRPNIITMTFSLCFSAFTSSMTPRKPLKGPSVTFTDSLMVNGIATSSVRIAVSSATPRMRLMSA